MGSKNGAEARLESRYYKRVFRVSDTRCCLIAWAVGLLLPLSASRAMLDGQSIPVLPPDSVPSPTTTAPAPASPLTVPAATAAPQSPAPGARAPYEAAWTQEITSTAPLDVTVGATVVILSGAGQPTVARAIDDGRVRWTIETDFATPPAASGSLIVGVSGDRVRAIDEATGIERWNAPVQHVVRSPVVTSDFVLVLDDDSLLAYRNGDGARTWREPFTAHPTGALAVDRNIAVLALDNSTLVAVDLAKGLVTWRATLTATPEAIGAAGDRVYFGTTAGNLCAYRQLDGKFDWCFPARVEAAGAPAFDDRLVYFALLDNTLTALDRRSGAMRRRSLLPGRPVSGPRMGLTHLIVPLANGEFSIVSMADGRLMAPVASPDQASAPSLQNAEAAKDGRFLAALTVAPGAKRSLIGFRYVSP